MRCGVGLGVAVVLAAVAGCGSGDDGAIAVSIDELAAGIELATIDDPDAVVRLAEAFALDGGPPPGEIAVDLHPNDGRFDVVLSYRTGGCPALPELDVDVDVDTIRFEVEIMSTGEPDCPAAEYIEAIGIGLTPEAAELPVEALLR